MAGDLGNIFGLDEFGMALTDLNTWAGPIGAGAQTLGSIAARKYGNDMMKKHHELTGALLGVAAGAGFWFTGRRDAGVACALSSLIVGGLRHMAGSGTFGELSGGYGLGMYSVDPMTSFNGLGMHSVESMPSLNGLGDLPQLQGSYGLNDNPAAASVALQGGPQISGLGAHFGSTIFS